MDKLEQAIKQIVSEQLYRIIISKPFYKGELSKIVIRPVMIKKELRFQETQYVGNKVLHENYNTSDICDKLIDYLKESFGQLEAECSDLKMTILTNKKGTVTVREKKKSCMAECDRSMLLTHNRIKNYILEEGNPVDFLIALGVQTPDGKIVKAKYHKFKQINRYLEFIEDILPVIEKEETIRIVDFGCGKSYLTFALYYYLSIKQNKNVDIIGLDLKKDVIEDCKRLSDKLGYRGLKFLQGNIKDYKNHDKVDMVVSLHACDTATDYAIARAVSWNAKVIMAVPCCQHEVNRQISCAKLDGVLQYGIIKERMSALITDAYRADQLQNLGYETQILEFIDLEHTPKNLLIRAVKKTVTFKSESTSEKEKIMLQDLEEYLNIQPLLGKLLKDKKDK